MESAMRYSVRSALGFLALVVWLAPRALAEAAPTTLPARPACAVVADPGLGLRDSPIIALLETQLANLEQVRLVERNEIDRVLREQELNLLFAPEGAGQRVKAGALVKADLLLLLRAKQERGADRSIQAVVCETKGGLRLRVANVPWPEREQATADRLVSILVQGLDKYAAPVRHLFAVPAFTGGDFLHRYDHLRWTYARSIEQCLVALPGVVVVELAEARAIAQELALAGNGSALQRQLPGYLIGEYHVEPGQPSDTADVTLILRQGETTVGERRLARIPLQEAIPAVQAAARELCAGTMTPATTRPDPAVEAKQLLARVAAFRRLQDFEEALNLVEAGLLIDPDNRQLCAEAALLGSTCMAQLAHVSAGWGPELTPGAPTEEYLSRAALALHYGRTAARYTYRWLQLTDIRNLTTVMHMNDGASTCDLAVVTALQREWLSWHKERATVPAEVQMNQEFARLYDDYREMLFHALEEKVAAGQITKANYWCFHEALHVKGYVHSEAQVPRYLRMIQNAPGLENEILGVLLEQATVFPSDVDAPIRMQDSLAAELLNPNTQTKLAELEALSGPTAREAARRLRGLITEAEAHDQQAGQAILDRGITWAEQEQRRTSVWRRGPNGGAVLQWTDRGQPAPELVDSFAPKSQPAGGFDVIFKPIQLRGGGSPGGLALEDDMILGWLACPGHLDVIWTPREVLVMRQPGVVKSIYRARAAVFANQHLGAELCYDGRYIWAPAAYAEKPFLLAIDPLTEKVVTLNSGQALPSMDTGLVVAPVEPGRACVAAAFGRPDGQGQIDRTWCGLVSIGEQGQTSVDLLLEAQQRPPQQLEPTDELNPDLVFHPRALEVLRYPTGKDNMRILLVRGWPHLPLLIDPKSRRREVLAYALDETGWPQPRFTTRGEGFIYYLMTQGPDAGTDMRIRIGFPDFAKDREQLPMSESGSRLRSALPIRALAAIDGWLHVLRGGDWWIARGWDHEFHRLEGDLPPTIGSHSWQRICASNHYGIVLLSADSFYSGTSIRQVIIKPEVLNRIKRETAQRDDEAQARHMEFEQRRQEVLAETGQDQNDSASPWWAIAGCGMLLAIGTAWMLLRKQRSLKPRPTDALSPKDGENRP
jgi:hypothetical protein